MIYSYFGQGTKYSIMLNLETVVGDIANIAYVDFQRIYDTGVGPEKFPGCFINDIIERKETILANITKNTFHVGVVFWVRAEDDENLWEKLDAFGQSIITAIMSDPTRGSNAYSSRVTQIETDKGSRHPVAVGVIVLEIIYFSGN